MSLPNLEHISADDYQHVYEPAEDTYLFVDALETQLKFLEKANMILEIGPGSGCISVSLASKLQNRAYFAVDINPFAVNITQKTAKNNNVEIQVINGSLLESIFDGKVDVIIFNPPYVPSDPEELESSDIEAAWAGGIDGREVIDKLLPTISVIILISVNILD